MKRNFPVNHHLNRLQAGELAAFFNSNKLLLFCFCLWLSKCHLCRDISPQILIPSENFILSTIFQSPMNPEELAIMEHKRWVNKKIGNRWTYSKDRNDKLKIHNCLLPWEQLDKKTKDLDRDAVRIIPELLKSVGLVVVKGNLISKFYISQFF